MGSNPDVQLDLNWAPEAEARRLSRQCAQILERLRQGLASNRDLADIALKYTSRISDLRQAGYTINCVQRDHETGLTFYMLEEDDDGGE